MTAEFRVLATSRFDREMKKLAERHAELSERFRGVVAILRADPLNRACRHSIKKLQGVSEGDGQYRARSGRFRFRYDVEGRTVYLKACSLRREDTY